MTDPILSLMDCIEHYVNASVELAMASAEIRDHKRIVTDRARANLELALRQVLPRRPPSVAFTRVAPEDEEKR